MAKGKDPAFLFYSKDFYEGTRTMLPEERACYIDLMIYQHQHGFIPDDLKRVCLYCNGVSIETLQAVLEAKFKLCLDGWYNETMQKVIDERNDFSSHQAINGKVGQFYKKAKAILKKNEYLQLRELLHDKTNQEVFNIIEGEEINEAMLKAMLVAMLKHLEDANADKDNSLFNIEDSNIEPYSFDDFWNDYGKKVDNRKCEAKWKSLSKKDKIFIKENVNLYVASTPDIKYRKNPLTYLNGQCWKDEIFKRSNEQLPPPNLNPTYERWDGQKRWMGSVEIPYDAPPRPNNLAKWDHKQNKWIYSNF